MSTLEGHVLILRRPGPPEPPPMTASGEPAPPMAPEVTVTPICGCGQWEGTTTTFPVEAAGEWTREHMGPLVAAQARPGEIPIRDPGIPMPPRK